MTRQPATKKSGARGVPRNVKVTIEGEEIVFRVRYDNTLGYTKSGRRYLVAFMSGEIPGLQDYLVLLSVSRKADL